MAKGQKKQETKPFTPEILGQSFASQAGVKSLDELNESFAYANGADISARGDFTSYTYSPANISRYNNLISRSFPFQQRNGYWHIREAVILCQTAWAYIPVFYQTIETMVSLANTNIRWVGGSKDGKNFAKVWWEKINGFNVTEQSLRELLRSGNLFLYKYTGTIKSNKLNKLIKQAGATNESKAAKNIEIPVKYVVINPADICTVSDFSLSYIPMYYRFIDISTKNKLNKISKDKDTKINLEDSLKKIVNNDLSNIDPLHPDNLNIVFYRKQDYEPFALPMGYSVLEDINLKLEFKKCDAVVSKTVESIIMLVTHGAKPDEGGMNPIVDSTLKQLFATKQVGRTLVSDYTTEIDFVIPDLKKVIGPEKYEKLDQDINDGLLNFFFGNQRFASLAIKLRIFTQTLTYLQNIYLNDFLIPEIKRVGKSIGLTEDEIPTPKFSYIKVEDPSQWQRVIAQFTQLGVLTPEEASEAIEYGILPIKEDSVENQKEYSKLRKSGLYLPLVGGADQGGDKQSSSTKPNGRPGGTKGIPNKVSTPAPKGTSSANHKFDIIKFRDILLLANDVSNNISKLYSKKNKKKELNEEDLHKISLIATHLVINEPPDTWMEKSKEYLIKLPSPNIENISLATEIKEVNQIEDDFAAAVLTHCIIK